VSRSVEILGTANDHQVVSPFQAILDYEKQQGIPTGYINFSIRELTPHGAWHQLERGEIKNDEHFMSAFQADLQRQDLWEKYHREKLRTNNVPIVPNIDAEKLYWAMMSTARENDPYMYPALKKLRESGRFHLAAMSNTTIFPEGHAFNERSAEDVRDMFDVFVSSAHVGLRKPNRNIYEYTMKQIKERWGDDIRPEEVVFLDDIGENLKMGRSFGFGTIRVFLGKSKDAVRQLGEVTGMDLLGESNKARL
jgi:HAD superfamily hydrolase (TIGR01509 family)